MHLLLLGLILVIGILVYYIMTTGAGDKGASSGRKKTEEKNSAPENLRKEDNVIFLPTADGSAPQEGADAPDKITDADVPDKDDGGEE